VVSGWSEPSTSAPYGLTKTSRVDSSGRASEKTVLRPSDLGSVIETTVASGNDRSTAASWLAYGCSIESADGADTFMRPAWISGSSWKRNR